MNGERLANFTQPPSWRDLARTLGLVFACWSLYLVCIFALWVGTSLGDQIDSGRNLDVFRTQMSVPYAALLVVNPFCEELWLRAFLQTRLGQLDWPAPLTVLISASLQASYHIYQGVAFVAAYAVVFAVLATYYQRTRRVWPVVGMHLVADVSAGI